MTIRYILSFPEPHTHYVQVNMHVEGFIGNEARLKMAVWTPGSYLIREFQRHIDFVEAVVNQETSRVSKCDKNTWILPLGDTQNFQINYNLYCNDLSVRTNFVNTDFALLNGAGTFLYLEGEEQQECTIEIVPYHSWKKISTALKIQQDNTYVRTAKDLDELIDSPILLGNQQQYYFEACGVPHELAMEGVNNCNIEKLISDLQKMIEEEVRVFGAHPCDQYTFINIHTQALYGGLEHKFSSVNMLPRWNYDKANYAQSIGLLSHEYFHLWNVKRIRPQRLSRFNYNEENYTDLLWFFEGVTSYYDDLVNQRAGILSREEYLDIVITNINSVWNTYGINIQTLEESSWDTWLKYYRKNENSNNTTISYYIKGAIVAMVLDFMLMDATKGEKNIDDVMKALYESYEAHPEKGITETDVLQLFNSLGNMDFAPYFHKFIHTTESIPIEFYFDLIGFHLIDKQNNQKVYLGMNVVWSEGKCIVTEVVKGYGAFSGGLNAEDEIIAVDGFRVSTDFAKFYENKKANESIDFIVSRQGEIKTLQIPVTLDQRVQYKLILNENLSPKQKVLLKKWIR